MGTDGCVWSKCWSRRALPTRAVTERSKGRLAGDRDANGLWGSQRGGILCEDSCRDCENDESEDPGETHHFFIRQSQKTNPPEPKAAMLIR